MNLNGDIKLKQMFYKKFKENIYPKITEIEKERQYFLKYNDSVGYKKYLKKHFLRDLLSCFEYIEQSATNNYVCNETEVLQFNDKINDTFSGVYKNIKFNIAEVSNGMVLGKKGVYSGPWNGIVLEIEFNKPIATFINISPRKEGGYILGICGGLLFCFISFILAYVNNSPSVLTFYNNFFPAMTPLFSGLWIFFAASVLFTLFLTVSFIKSTMEKINLEDVNFEKKYYVEAQNQIEARYILTPSFIEKLNNLQTVFCEKNTWISFSNKKITFSFETDNDLFELGNLCISITNKDVLENFYNEITAITDIIDYFKLDQKIGL